MVGSDLGLRWLARMLLIVSAGLFIAGHELWGAVAVLASVLLLVGGRVVQVRRDESENRRD